MVERDLAISIVRGVRGGESREMMGRVEVSFCRCSGKYDYSVERIR